jgi:hypothetical protein
MKRPGRLGSSSDKAEVAAPATSDAQALAADDPAERGGPA